MEPEVRRVVPAMRWVFGVGSLLAAAAGVQVFLLTRSHRPILRVNDYTGPSAAFLGAFYLTVLVLAAGSAIQVEWARARVGAFGLWLFVTLTVVATMLHLDRFHFHAADAVLKGAAWLWVAIYLVEPFAVFVAIALQLRAHGYDRPRTHPLPRWYRGLLLLQCASLFVAGAWLFGAPTAVGWRPRPLTPLSPRRWQTGCSVWRW